MSFNSTPDSGSGGTHGEGHAVLVVLGDRDTADGIQNCSHTPCHGEALAVHVHSFAVGAARGVHRITEIDAVTAALLDALDHQAPLYVPFPKDLGDFEGQLAFAAHLVGVPLFFNAEGVPWYVAMQDARVGADASLAANVTRYGAVAHDVLAAAGGRCLAGEAWIALNSGQSALTPPEELIEPTDHAE